MSNPKINIYPIKEELFINVREVIAPKDIPSLVSLWMEDLPQQLQSWSLNNKGEMLITKMSEAIIAVNRYLWYKKGKNKMRNLIFGEDSVSLYGIVRAIHIKFHLEDIDDNVKELLHPFVNQDTTTTVTHHQPFTPPMVLQTFLHYLHKYGVDEYERWVNSSLLRLVSTAHPNETERNSNLRHYASLFEKYLTWKKDMLTVQTIPQSTLFYRANREQMNQLRRAIKAEIESVWQSDQMRNKSISVESEAQRILERYKIILKTYPQWVKFIKHLNAEAFWRYSASMKVNDKVWRKKYEEISSTDPESHRQEKLKYIKATFRSLEENVKIPHIVAPLISFGTWKGGDRDGNPYVLASFTNKTFLEHKIFILKEYITIVNTLVDKITPSIHHIPVSKELDESLAKDRLVFPYIINNIKVHEKYRTKLRYISEKLQNTFDTSNRVIMMGSTVKPLLGQCQVGPNGYSDASEFINDVSLVFESLTENAGKCQAKSLVQDLHILATTFGFSLASLDFRQTSTKNMCSCVEYLEAVGFEEAKKLPNMPEDERRKVLLSLLVDENISLESHVIQNLKVTTRDTLQTMIIFADAARADSKAVGKFIISLCSSVSDYLILFFFLKLVGILQVKDNKIVSCPFDVTGLFETVEDLRAAPFIVTDLFSVDLIRNYISEHRSGFLTIMLGYSDSVRDGSSLASDAQVSRTALTFRDLQHHLNETYLPKPHRFEFIFYRGRGDTLPRGYGGSIEGAIYSQSYTTTREDHTEQNRYLRRYFSEENALNHYHKIYGAHLGVLMRQKNTNEERYQMFFDFFGVISNMKWNSLVRKEDGGKGEIYFRVLDTYSILPHLNKSHFASRPIYRDKEMNISTIRAIPFSMNLAQLRDFSSAFYGTGTAYDLGSKYLQDEIGTIKSLIVICHRNLSPESFNTFLRSDNPIHVLLNKHYLNLDDILTQEGRIDKELLKILSFYHDITKGVNAIVSLIIDLNKNQTTPIAVLKEMFLHYEPFRYSTENKETTLQIRNKEIIDLYLEDCTEEEKAIFDECETEAQLTKRWILEIMDQKELLPKSTILKKSLFSSELYLLHLIQSHFLRKYRKLKIKGIIEVESYKKKNEGKNEEENEGKKEKIDKIEEIEEYIQMTILAISEGLGFGG